MPTVIASGFGPIILAVKQQVMTICELDATQVKIVSRDPSKVPKWSGAKEVVLRVLNFVVNQKIYEGAGRTCVRLTRWFDAICRSRNSLDEAQVDESFLTDTSELGFLPFEEQVGLAVCGFYPVDADGNHLTVEEIRLYDGDAPEKDQVMPEWGDSSLRFEVEYMLLLGGSPL